MKRKAIFNLEDAFLDLQKEMIQSLSIHRKHIKHAVAKGNAFELNWIKTLGTYLPKRYCIDKAFVIDCKGNTSEEIDAVIYDRQYSPFLFVRENSKYIPAESVYAVFEIKPTINKRYLKYAGQKATSVRTLYRTSVPISYVEGTYKKKKLFKIISGILTLDSEWKDPFSNTFIRTLEGLKKEEQIDIGCILEKGAFEIEYKSNKYYKCNVSRVNHSFIFFFLKLLSKLQKMGTCSAMSIEKYGKTVLNI